MSGLLAVTAEIETPGGWLSLEDPENGYSLHKESFASRQFTSRKVELEGDWVEGSYVARAVRGNTNETLAVFIEGATPFEREMRQQELVSGLEQLQYRMRVTEGDSRETWTCFYTDYQLEATQELRFSTLVILRATVPRLPTVLREQVA